MYQAQREFPIRQQTSQNSSSAFVYVGVFLGILICFAFTAGVSFGLSTLFRGPSVSRVAPAVPVERHVQVHLDIVMNQPGMQKDWPGYAPNNLVVPANSLVTVVLRDYDLGDTPLPANSPFTTVQGTVGSSATMDGQTFSSLAPAKIAHTFTVSQLHLNVPLPGDAPKGAAYDTITFTFHTGKAGTYTFQCFDPCGTGSTGWMGPMMTKGYMVGTLTVQ